MGRAKGDRNCLPGFLLPLSTSHGAWHSDGSPVFISNKHYVNQRKMSLIDGDEEENEASRLRRAKEGRGATGSWGCWD